MIEFTCCFGHKYPDLDGVVIVLRSVTGIEFKYWKEEERNEGLDLRTVEE